MMFLQAGFNARNRRTGIVGWTRHVRDPQRRFAAAQLRRFACGDYFWMGETPSGTFLAWGDCVVLGSYGIDLPWHHQEYLPMCRLDQRHRRGEDCVRCGGSGVASELVDRCCHLEDDCDQGMCIGPQAEQARCTECYGEGAIMRRAA